VLGRKSLKKGAPSVYLRKEYFNSRAKSEVKYASSEANAQEQQLEAYHSDKRMDEEDSEVEHNGINLMTRTVDGSEVYLTSEAESEAKQSSEDESNFDEVLSLLYHFINIMHIY
jgi:hypothetical protein